MGRGGEMAEFATDSLAPDVATAADVAMLRPPSALWGYNVQVTDDALNQISQLIAERDVEIAVLRQQLAELQAATGSRTAVPAGLLARSKAATARSDNPGLDAMRRQAGDAISPAPGPDAGLADAGLADAGLADAGLADAGLADAGLADAGLADAGAADTGLADAGAADTGLADAEPANAGPADTGPADAGAADTGSADTGLADPGSAPRSEEAAASRDD
jgi:hypothetical protein